MRRRPSIHLIVCSLRVSENSKGRCFLAVMWHTRLELSCITRSREIAVTSTKITKWPDVIKRAKIDATSIVSRHNYMLASISPMCWLHGHSCHSDLCHFLWLVLYYMISWSSGPGFSVCFLAVSTPEVSWDQLSWAQVYRFRFFCFCVSWAHREQADEMTGDREQTGKVSHVPWARLSCVIMTPT